MKLKYSLILFLICLSIKSSLIAQNTSNIIDNSQKSILENTDFSGLYFLSYLHNSQTNKQQFLIKRGYFTIKTKLSEKLSVRYTQDITLDEEGDDAGNIEIRVKYLYLKANILDIAFLKHNYVEFGMIQRPWIDFEQKINPYRVQGRMFAEEFRLLPSADVGVTFVGLLGGKLNKEYRNKINNSYAGKYGSIAFGIFNGGGYHAIENNNNKLFESRVSLRPFPEHFTGFQLTHGLALGKGNNPKPASDFFLNIIMLSAEAQSYKITAQYVKGNGNSSGTFSDSLYNSYPYKGFSFFGEYKIPKTNFAIFSRYDNFNIDQDFELKTETYIAGVTYRFLKNKVLIDYQKTNNPSNPNEFIELALEISF